MLDAISQIERTQIAWLLLYFCAAPRANYFLRTVPCDQLDVYTLRRNQEILKALSRLLGMEVSGDGLVDVSQHWARQALLPIRHGGLGLRDARRIAPAAYWASMADSLSTISNRFPGLGRRLLDLLQLSGEREVPSNLVSARTSAAWLDAAGMTDRPTWEAVAAGARPMPPTSEECMPGKWQKGWQYYASEAFEQGELTHLLRTLRGPGPAPGPGRVPGSANLSPSHEEVKICLAAG